MGYKIFVSGIVQGVGFRPFVYDLALKLTLKGYVTNTTDGVEIYLEEDEKRVNDFIDKLIKNSPVLAMINDVKVISTKEEKIYDKFIIKPSNKTSGVTIVPADASICKDCSFELFNESDPKYRYPFINCTNCGPRYSIIENIPYDRKNTSMKTFQICKTCKDEYEDPTNRRFHAQPNACGKCGPKIFFRDIEGEELLKKAGDFLNKGKIIGVKGIGGYHIMCDALNLDAVNRIRAFKMRNFKPFALMIRNIDLAKKYGIYFTDEEKKLFESPIAPIIIKEIHDTSVFSHINQIGKNVGIMPPYTPLHLLIFDYFKGDLLVATSGNKKDEPIAIDTDSAEKTLSVCDFFIHHNRKIVNRVDDSLVRFVGNAPYVSPYVLRRSRGYAPLPVMVENINQLEAVGVGANLKNSICFLKKNYAFISQYIGDLENYETNLFFEEVFNRMKNLFEVNPSVVITDLHPDFYSSKFAKTLNIKVVKVQHHIAHMASTMAEHKLVDNVMGVVFDGTGLGSDGNIWGGEVFVKKGDFIREYHLENTPLVGSDSAIKYPYRMFLSYLCYFNIPKDEISKNSIEKEYHLISQMIKNKFNILYTSSMGRLFEAIGAYLLDIYKNEFEAHSAMALEGICVDEILDFYEFSITNKEIKIRNILVNIINDVKNGVKKEIIATKFHNTIAQIVHYLAKEIRSRYNINDVCLSGGVFQNIFLLKRVIALLEEHGFNTYIHKNVPANDGSISLGQIYYYLLNAK